MPRASTSPHPARDIQEDAADLAAVIPWLPGPPLQLRRGLTDQDLERITRATEAARSPGTHKIYQYAWEQWATWCAERGFDPLPADPAAMCAFMTQRVADGLAVISLSPFISVINYVHSAASTSVCDSTSTGAATDIHEPSSVEWLHRGRSHRSRALGTVARVGHDEPTSHPDRSNTSDSAVSRNVR